MPTVTDPLHPERIRELLLRLQASVSSISGREAALTRTHAAGVLAAKRHSTARREAGEAAHGARQRDLQAQSEAEHDNMVRKYDARRSWMNRAAQAAQSGLSRRVRAEKDRQVGMRQAQTMRSKEEAKELWERSRQDHREFAQGIAADFEETAAAARGAVKVVRSFQPLFSLMLRKGKFVKGEAADTSKDRETLRKESQQRLAEATEQLGSLRRNPLAGFFRFVPLTALLVVIGGAFGYMIYSAPDRAAKLAELKPMLLVALLAPIGLHLLSALLLLPSVRRMSITLQSSRNLGAAAAAVSEAKVTALGESLKREVAQQSEGLSETLRGSEEIGQEVMQSGRRKIEAQVARLPAKAEALHQRNLGYVTAWTEHTAAELDAEYAAEVAARDAEYAAGVAAADAARQQGLDALLVEWVEQVKPVHSELLGLAAQAEARFPGWDESWIGTWAPPETAERALPFGKLHVLMKQLAGGMPESAIFTLDGPAEFDIPLALGFPDRGSVMLEGDATAAAATINEIVLRVLTTHPAGRAIFTLIDPVGLGKDFAGLMHLGDYEETLIHGRIWTQTTQIEERLAEINEHIEKVIQMYLRNEYATLDEYNEQAGTVAEKQRFVVVSGFPAAFSDTASKRLLSIATSGARCGVYLLVHRDPRQQVDPALADALEKACLRLVPHNDHYRLVSMPAGADQTVLSAPPKGDLETALVHRLGQASVDSNRVEVPFSHISPPESEWWTSSTGDELRVPIGRSGAKKFQMLALGKGTRQHALIAGKTGSGKSTLFHVMITNLALHCSPDEVEFYLVDFKKGVEFKCYGSRRLPHARVVAIESDREFGLSVLQRVDDELRRRGELFRKAGVQDVAGYRKASGQPLPRTLLMIDEFQEIFTEDDSVAQSASLLLDRIVRQGRAFGIHVILGSQTLGGAYTLARATIGQMVVRIALQCNEADAYLIMDDDNPAPRLLTRPGEGIYNDNAGALAANSPFQTVWLAEDDRNAMLDRVTALAAERGRKPAAPVVFEGNAPADLDANLELAGLLAERPQSRPAEIKAWLGEPNAIKGPTEAVFGRRSGSHMLLVGQSDERVATLLEVASFSLAAGLPADGGRFVILDGSNASKRLAASLPQDVKVVGPAGVADAIGELAAELAKRSAGESDGPEIFVVIHGMQKFKKLRQEDDFLFSMDDGPSGPNPSKVLADIASEGGPLGIHIIAGVDTWNNVSRWLPRKVMAEFEMRVLFQMSANDSANLIDSPAAGSLGLHRALLYNEAHGTTETFRPYADPEGDWWAKAAEQLKAGALEATG
ncbi:FtsK/SpoIIIE domain-containing protein [Luteolibacter flavescens]|uniref:FtsK/SpoIIIE domain-containing protein n=1 Tax=Luteolibacter flavescens TaxID=1859460 RepID=A0ABT3FS60_9BACT|nr:FtsK/SpoIIIE domain-containing protein [Luteolibacter flavescens]MCW1886419.1 FtsK/SpoIIIE domain-containing protein [Luteolibacter flavescens]